MKFIIPSALAAALLSPASATCAIRGNNAAATIMTSTGSCFPGPTGGDSSSSDSCNDLRQAASFCRTYININYSSWCSGAPSMKTLQGRCKNAVRYLEDEDSGAEVEADFWDDSGDEEDEDAPVLAVDTANTYQRGARCGKYTAGTAAAQAGVNIVNRIWLDSGKDCRYATRQFTGDVESALLNEFPDNCRDTGAYDANQSGRRAGENYMNRIISDCSQPVPRPTPPPRRPSRRQPTRRQPTRRPTRRSPTRPPTRRITDRDIRNACGYVKNCNGCKKQCSGSDIKEACKAQYCSIEEMLEDEFETALSE